MKVPTKGGKLSITHFPNLQKTNYINNACLHPADNHPHSKYRECSNTMLSCHWILASTCLNLSRAHMVDSRGAITWQSNRKDITYTKQHLGLLFPSDVCSFMTASLHLEHFDIIHFILEFNSSRWTLQPFMIQITTWYLHRYYSGKILFHTFCFWISQRLGLQSAPRLNRTSI